MAPFCLRGRFERVAIRCGPLGGGQGWEGEFEIEVGRARPPTRDSCAIIAVGMGRGRYNAYVELERQRAAAARRQAAEIRRLEAEERRDARLQLQAHLQGRQHEADERNEELQTRIRSLETVLKTGLQRPSALNFDTLKRPVDLPPFDAQGAGQPARQPTWEEFAPRTPGFFAKLVPGTTARHQAAVSAAQQALQAKQAEWSDYEQKRQAWLKNARAEHEAACGRLRQEIDSQHADVDAFRSAWQAGDPEAVRQYFTILLERDDLPEGCPQQVRVAYMPEPKQLVVERQLPTVDVIPEVKSYHYVKVSDAFSTTKRPANQTRSLYVSVVAQVALRTLHVIFSADTGAVLATVVLNCIVDTVSPETGHRVRPCLLTVRASRDDFAALDLTNVEPAACLRYLKAEVSPRPHELQPVRPVIDFDMVDPRFIDTADVQSTLDQRPNLAQLTPSEFEALITNVFEKMNLETRQTRASRDGGVDCVAWDMRPVVGGKVIIQAKRYRNPVGVSAVRDLYERAAKGILVSTGAYTAAAYQFVRTSRSSL